MRLREFNAEIRNGNVLIVDCCGVKDGEQHCCGRIRIPFEPVLGQSPAKPTETGKIWRRISGATVDDLTLDPSIDAGECGHFHVQNGRIVK